MYEPNSMLDFKRKKFEVSYSDLDKAETLKEILFLQKMQNDNLVIIRKNTGKLVWILIILILPLILSIISAVYKDFF